MDLHNWFVVFNCFFTLNCTVCDYFVVNNFLQEKSYELQLLIFAFYYLAICFCRIKIPCIVNTMKKRRKITCIVNAIKRIQTQPYTPERHDDAKTYARTKHETYTFLNSFIKLQKIFSKNVLKEWLSINICIKKFFAGTKFRNSY